ncbi:MAG: hypothetical protein AAF578_01390 [Pseudomonadota bacterium]
MNVDDYQAKITSLLYDEIRAAIPPLLAELEGQSIFAFGLVSFDGPCVQGVAACSREGLAARTEELNKSAMSSSKAEVYCAEWNYLGNAVSESLDLSYELSDKFYDGAVEGLDESVSWDVAQERFNRVFLDAGVYVLARLRDSGKFPVPPFEADLFLGLHNPDPGRDALHTMIASSKVLNSAEWHAKLVTALPDPTSIDHA